MSSWLRPDGIGGGLGETVLLAEITGVVEFVLLPLEVVLEADDVVWTIVVLKSKLESVLEETMIEVLVKVRLDVAERPVEVILPLDIDRVEAGTVLELDENEIGTSLVVLLLPLAGEELCIDTAVEVLPGPIVGDRDMGTAILLDELRKILLEVPLELDDIDVETFSAMLVEL